MSYVTWYNEIVDLKTGFLRIFFWRFIDVKRNIQQSRDLIDIAIFVMTLISGLAAGGLSPLPCKIFTTTEQRSDRYDIYELWQLISCDIGHLNIKGHQQQLTITLMVS
jgi:hypothetical protein